jgi:hypothetical protein
MYGSGAAAAPEEVAESGVPESEAVDTAAAADGAAEAVAVAVAGAAALAPAPEPAPKSRRINGAKFWGGGRGEVN